MSEPKYQSPESTSGDLSDFDRAILEDALLESERVHLRSHIKMLRNPDQYLLAQHFTLTPTQRQEEVRKAEAKLAELDSCERFSDMSPEAIEARFRALLVELGEGNMPPNPRAVLLRQQRVADTKSSLSMFENRPEMFSNLTSEQYNGILDALRRKISALENMDIANVTEQGIDELDATHNATVGTLFS